MRDGDATTPATVPAARTVRAALAAAAVLLRRSILTVLVAVLTVQGVLVWIILPALATLFRAVLTSAGIDGINQASFLDVLTTPIALIALIGFGLVAVLFIVLELAVFAVIAHLRFDGQATGYGSVLRGLARTGRRLLSWQSVVLVPYIVVLLPLSHVGASSVLTGHVAIPSFVSGELQKTTVGALAYWVLIVVIVYVALRLVLTMAHLTAPGSGADTTILAAMRRSLSRTWRLQGPLAIVLLGTAVVASAVLILAAAVGLFPVVLGSVLDPNGGGAVATGVTLALLDIVRFLVTGIGAAFLSFVFVAIDRMLDGRPVAGASVPGAGALAAPVSPDPAAPHAPASAAGRTTRVIAGAVIVAAVLLAVPRVISSAQTSPGIGAAAATDVIAHRGYTAGGVENSLEALRAAAQAGADRVELDIQETSDGGFVVIHDVSLRRLAGDPRSVYELTEAEASALTIRQNGFTSRIPTLDEFVAEADALDMPLLVEVKPHGREQPGFAARVTATMNRLDPAHRDIVQSLDRPLIEEIAALDPDRPTAYVVGLQLGDLPESSSGAVVIEDWSYSDSMLSAAHGHGRGLYVWTVDDAERIDDYLRRGVDGIITDEVRRAVTERRLQSEVTNPVSVYLERVMRLVRIG